MFICTDGSKIRNRILHVSVCLFPVCVVIGRYHHKTGLHRLTVPVSQNANYRSTSRVSCMIIILFKVCKFYALIMCRSVSECVALTTA